MLLGARQFFERRGGTPPLPYDAEVEYIENTVQASWIDTGIVPTKNTGIETDMSITFAPHDLGGISGMCGTGYFAGGGSYAQYITRVSGSEMTLYTWAFGGYEGVPISIQYGTRTLFSHNFMCDGKVMIDDVQKAVLPANPTLQQYRITVFKLNVADNANNVIFYVKGKLYRVRISELNQIVRDMIPVRFTNEQNRPEGAMYDRVSGALFRNAGTGAFTIGPDKS